MRTKLVLEKYIKFFGPILIGVVIFSAMLFSPPAVAALNLDGRILLQVESRGEAWYVNPLDSSRYYLGRPTDAFDIMRSLGLGVSNVDLAQFKISAPARLSGRILLQVQDRGQAYYVSPTDRKLYYLGRPADAFNVMRSLGLGITNADLAKIKAASSGLSAALDIQSAAVNLDTPLVFSFKYKNDNYSFNQSLSSSLYNVYQSSAKVYSYSGVTVSDAVLRESFYALFFNVKPGDASLDDLMTKVKAMAANHNWSNDETAEFALALVQFIPYDNAKLAAGNNRNNNPYYPYETLYLDRGVCSDKTFLAVALLRRLGYGAAILDFPEKNHSAAGIACPAADSLSGSGYCYVETTNYFPFGAVPQSISSGQADTADSDFTELFTTLALGRLEVYQQTSGKSYQGVAANRARAAALQAQKDDLAVRAAAIEVMASSTQAEEDNLSELRAQMDAYQASGQIAEYNAMVTPYNEAVNQYNANLAAYKQKISEYNKLVNDFNQGLAEFYQK